MDLFDPNLKISTNYISLDYVSINDSENIYSLRKKHKNSVLKSLNGSLDDQKKYLSKYLVRFNNREEIYFSIKCLKTNDIFGYVRLTELNNDYKFSYESLILKETSPKFIALDSILTIYKIGFNFLNREVCGPWVVPLDGKRIINLHTKMNLINIIAETKKYYICQVLKEKYLSNINFFDRLGLGNLNFS